jgi:uncharacterized protein (DUF433 family)
MKFATNYGRSADGGVPCIGGLRVAVIGMIAEGMTTIDILAGYPDLEHEDIQA